jgi:hypothetical protein
MCSLGMTFGKTETAHGGCLGVCGRGRTRADGDTRRGAVTTHRSCGFLMGQPASLRARHCQTAEGTGPTETSHVARGTETIPVVAASEPGLCPNHTRVQGGSRCAYGVGGRSTIPCRVSACDHIFCVRSGLEHRATDRDSRVDTMMGDAIRS